MLCLFGLRFTFLHSMHYPEKLEVVYFLECIFTLQSGIAEINCSVGNFILITKIWGNYVKRKETCMTLELGIKFVWKL